MKVIMMNINKQSSINKILINHSSKITFQKETGNLESSEDNGLNSFVERLQIIGDCLTLCESIIVTGRLCHYPKGLPISHFTAPKTDRARSKYGD